MAGELITADRQIEWAGLLLGDGTVYAVAEVPGWEDLPSLDSGSAPRAQQIGSRPGQLLAQSRAISCTIRVTADSDDWPAVRAALLAATTVRQDEQPLIIRLAGQPLLAWARITRRVMSTDTDGATGTPSVSLLWEASDPRRYVVTESTASAVLPIAETGLSFGTPTETGLSFGSPTETGLSFGTPGSTGDLIATNSGTTDAHPVIEIRGPVTTPTVTLGALRLEYDITLGAADTLVIDTWAGTVTLGGQDRLYTATNRSAPEGLVTVPPGMTTVSFRADPASTDPAAQVTVRWRSAYL
ncbi:phage tail domain-containing protein [Streptomyces sp. LS1784]|uniref:phage tail domain-containing protein n=1 Tax=Streptomyces sp. LS1784 TaxID=2851533 RepID=UPI001CCAB722|nr:phage tail domain-containing protein [Streptomyces sp. LS1784]